MAEGSCLQLCQRMATTTVKNHEALTMFFSCNSQVSLRWTSEPRISQGFSGSFLTVPRVPLWIRAHIWNIVSYVSRGLGRPSWSSLRCRGICITFDTRFLDQLWDGLLKVINTGAHVINAIDYRVRHGLESALHLFQQVLHEQGQVLVLIIPLHGKLRGTQGSTNTNTPVWATNYNTSMNQTLLAPRDLQMRKISNLNYFQISSPLFLCQTRPKLRPPPPLPQVTCTGTRGDSNRTSPKKVALAPNRRANPASEASKSA